MFYVSHCDVTLVFFLIWMTKPRSFYFLCAVFDESLSHSCQMRKLVLLVFNLLVRFVFVLTRKIRHAFKHIIIYSLLRFNQLK